MAVKTQLVEECSQTVQLSLGSLCDFGRAVLVATRGATVLVVLIYCTMSGLEGVSAAHIAAGASTVKKYTVVTVFNAPQQQR